MSLRFERGDDEYLYTFAADLFFLFPFSIPSHKKHTCFLYHFFQDASHVGALPRAIGERGRSSRCRLRRDTDRMCREFGVEALSRCWVIFGDLSIEYHIQGSIRLLPEGGVNSHWQTNFPRLVLIMPSHMLRNSIHLHACNVLCTSYTAYLCPAHL